MNAENADFSLLFSVNQRLSASKFLLPIESNSSYEVLINKAHEYLIAQQASTPRQTYPHPLSLREKGV